MVGIGTRGSTNLVPVSMSGIHLSHTSQKSVLDPIQGHTLMPVQAYMISTPVKGPHQSGMIWGNANLIIPVAGGLGLVILYHVYNCLIPVFGWYDLRQCQPYYTSSSGIGTRDQQRQHQPCTSFILVISYHAYTSLIPAKNQCWAPIQGPDQCQSLF
jgi:hypothetical protein